MVSLDPVGAKDRLLPLLQVPVPAVVDRAAKILRPMLLPQDLPRLLEGASSRFPASRRAAIGQSPLSFGRRQTVRRDCLCPASARQAGPHPLGGSFAVLGERGADMKHPLPYGFAKASTLLLEDDGSERVLWATDTASPPGP